MFTILLTVAKFLGLSPFNEDDKRLCKIIQIVVFVVYVACGFCYMSMGFSYGFLSLSTTYVILTITQFISQTSLYSLCFVFTFSKLSNWKILINGLDLMNDYYLRAWEYLLLGFLHLLFFSVILADGYFYIFMYNSYTIYISSQIYHCRQYFQYFIAYFISLIARLIARNYRKFGEKFKQCSREMVSEGRISDISLAKEVQKIKACWRKNGNIVKEFNVIFGLQIGIFFISTVLEILSGVSWYLKVRIFDSTVLVAYIFQVFISVVSILENKG